MTIESPFNDKKEKNILRTVVWGTIWYIKSVTWESRDNKRLIL